MQQNNDNMNNNLPPIDILEKEVSVLAALPRQVRCCRVVPQQSFVMLASLITGLVQQADEAASLEKQEKQNKINNDNDQQQDNNQHSQKHRRSSSSTSNNNNNNKKSKKENVENITARPNSIVFLERADVWCDLLNEFAETAIQYSSDMPLTAEQITAHASERRHRIKQQQHQQGDNEQFEENPDFCASGTVGLDTNTGAFVDRMDRKNINNNHNNNSGDQQSALSGQQQISIDGNSRHQLPDSVVVNVGKSVMIRNGNNNNNNDNSDDRRSITSKDFPVGAITRDLSPDAPSPTSRKHHRQQLSNQISPLRRNILLVASNNNNHNRPTSPGHNAESELYNFLRKAVGTSSSSSSSFENPHRRVLLIKLLVKERLRDTFVEMGQELAATIRQPKSYFAPPDVEIATRDYRTMQAEASKFGALVIELYGQIESELTKEFTDAFEFCNKAVEDGGLVNAVSDRSRRERMQRLVHLVTDVFLTLSILDAQRSEATINVARSLLSLAGLESRRSCHENALALASEAASKLSKLYAKEVSTILEFRNAAATAPGSTSNELDGNRSHDMSGYSSLINLAGYSSPFRFLCQIHDNMGQGFPAPLQVVSDDQKSTLENVVQGIQQRLGRVVPLRVAAHFNRASEMEHKQATPTECRAEYTTALTAGTSPRLPDCALPPDHPLMRRVSEALASLVADAAEKSRQLRFSLNNSIMNNHNNNNRASSARNSTSVLPPLSSSQQQQQQQSLVPQPPRSAKTPTAPPSQTFSRVTAAPTASGSSAGFQHNNAGGEIARMIGGSDIATKLTQEEVDAVKNAQRTPGWADDTKTDDDDNLKMLKQFGIVPEGTELKKKQRPISSVAHLDDNFIQDAGELYQFSPKHQHNEVSEGDFASSLTLKSAAAADVSPTEATSSGLFGERKRSIAAKSVINNGSKPALLTSQLDKALEDKLSSRQVQILAGVHGMLDAKANKTHARYEAELDSIIIRCKRAFAERDRSARVIQCAWRCAVARLEAYNRRQVYYHFLYQVQKAAGSAILSTFRTHHQQKKFEHARDGMIATRQAAAQLELRQRKAILTITRAIKKFMKQKIYEQELMRKLRIKEREKLVRSDIAAAIVQRWWKIIKYESKYWKKRNLECEQARLEDALALSYHAAATKIQRVFRGHIGRYEALLVKNRVSAERMSLRRSVNIATDTVRTLLLEYRARRNRLELLETQTIEKRGAAQKKIKSGWMFALERRKMKLVHARAREVSLAARTLQCWWKCRLARKELSYKRKVAQTITMVRIRQEWSSLRAAWVIQGAWRIYKATRELRKLKAGLGREKINATWLMQAVGRAYFVRQNLCQERNLVSSLVGAALKNAHKTRDEHVVLLQQFLRPRTSQHTARGILERQLAEKVIVWKRMRQEQRQDRGSQFFQGIGRGYLVRRDLLPKIVVSARFTAENRFVAARTIQCAYKSSAARDQLRQMKDSKARHLERQRVWGEVHAQLHEDRVAALALNEQSSRQANAKSQREVRKAIISAFLYQEQYFYENEKQVNKNEDVQSNSNEQEERVEHSKEVENKKVRILRMYDDSDEEEKDLLVQKILNQ